MIRLSASLFSLVFFLSAATVQAQYNVVTETEKMMSFGSRPCFKVEFSNADDDLVLDVWKGFVKQNFGGKLKKIKKTDEWSAAELSSGIGESFTVYSTVEKSGKGVTLYAWFDLGTSFVSRRENATAAREASDAMRQFYYDVRRATINAEIQIQEDRLKELDNRMKKLKRDNDGLHRDIENYKAKIKKAEEDIKNNEKEQDDTLLDLETQRMQIEEIRRRLENVENEGN